MAVHFSIVPVNNSRILYNLINFLYINHNLNCWWNFHDNFKKSHKSSRGMPFSTTRAPDTGSLSCIFPFRVRVHKKQASRPTSCFFTFRFNITRSGTSSPETQTRICVSAPGQILPRPAPPRTVSPQSGYAHLPVCPRVSLRPHRHRAP